jgi:hypothetical protein
MKFLLASLLAGSAAAFTTNGAQRFSTQTSMATESVEDLKVLARKLNPVLGYFDPLGLSERNFWGTTSEETIGFLRESEVKHGRIAMFAFVGYIVHANGIHFPWAIDFEGHEFPSVSNAPEAWDSISEAGRLQILAFIGFLEVWREVACEKHYMKGGKIGEFPAFDAAYIPGGALNLYDPFGWHKDRQEDEKANGLVKEINNGRLAMLGIMGFLSEGKVEGSVPSLSGIIGPYAGEPMAPLDHSILMSF